MSGGGRKGERRVRVGKHVLRLYVAVSLKHFFFVCVCNQPNWKRTRPIAVHMVYKCAGFCPFLSVASNLML